MALGGTVEEVKQRMSYAEAQKWFAYRRRYGGIGHARDARLLALLCTTLNSAHGGKADFEDFYYLERPPMSEDAFLDKFMGMFEG